MPDISQITLPSGTTYDIKDAIARATMAGAIIIRGTTTTSLVDEAQTNPITIDGQSYTAVANDAVFYNKKEYVFDGTYWHEFGDMSGLGDLALKDTASATYTPQGTITQPTFSGSAMTASGAFTPAGTIQVNESSGAGTAFTPAGTISVNSSAGTGTSFTPEGNVTAPTISLTSAGNTSNITPFGSAGSLPVLSMTVLDGNLSISWNAGSLASGGEQVAVKVADGVYGATAPTFTGIEKKLAFTGTEKKLAFSGTEGSVSVSGTPEGTVTQPTFSGSQATIVVS